MKKIKSINLFTEVLDISAWEAHKESSEFIEGDRNSNENGYWSNAHFWENEKEQFYRTVPKFPKLRELQDINNFDVVKDSEYSITVYWNISGQLKPAYRLKFEEAKTSSEDLLLSDVLKNTALNRVIQELVEFATSSLK